MVPLSDRQWAKTLSAMLNSYLTKVTSRKSNVLVSWQKSCGNKMKERERHTRARNMEGLKQ